MSRKLCKSELKDERGWTDTLIRKFVPTPDDTKPNPYSKNAAPMQLYCPERIKSIEQTPEFQERFAKSAARKSGAKKGVQTKTANLRQKVSREKIGVPKFKMKKLIEKACDHYNALQSFYNSDLFASEHSPLIFLQRICVNYLRHELTQYDEVLDKMKGKVGCNDVYWDVRDKVLDKIAEQYPMLAEECRRQKIRL
jgi:hypothetical protein